MSSKGEFRAKRVHVHLPQAGDLSRGQMVARPGSPRGESWSDKQIDKAGPTLFHPRVVASLLETRCVWITRVHPNARTRDALQCSPLIHGVLVAFPAPGPAGGTHARTQHVHAFKYMYISVPYGYIGKKEGDR